jgi:hypothetical protein
MNRYIVYWKSFAETEKGTVWLWCSPEMTSHPGLRHDEFIPVRSTKYRPALLNARGIKWTVTWEDGTSHTFKGQSPGHQTGDGQDRSAMELVPSHPAARQGQAV